MLLLLLLLLLLYCYAGVAIRRRNELLALVALRKALGRSI